ncbi:hypothetical protein A6X20_24215 [Bradyrhizobium elkanii]|nr:hypothetical protein A6X20_24215 [Bradyrhizobium elkanii]
MSLRAPIFDLGARCLASSNTGHALRAIALRARIIGQPIAEIQSLVGLAPSDLWRFEQSERQQG